MQNVRNYWISGTVDGRQTRLEGGPQSKDGGFSLTVYMRDGGEITKPLRVEGYADAAGNLRLEVRDGAGATVHTVKATR